MRIEQSQAALASRRVASTTDMTRSSMQAWIGDRPAQSTSAGSSVAQAQAATRAAIARLSTQALPAARDATRLTLASTTSAASPAGASSTVDPTDPTVTDPKLAALIMLIERLTGHKVRLVHLGIPTDPEAAGQRAGAQPAALAQTANAHPQHPQRAGWGVEVHVEQTHQETEATDFAASGQVVTEDGRTISFDYRLAMRRDLTQTSATDIQAGDAVKKVDPVALNLSGGPVALDSNRSAFDINSDGTAEQVALPAAGTYFLALDRNGNGTIDDGSELFGPATRNGFTELKALDGDHNGWIDQGDAAYASLRLWTGPDGEQKSLAEAGVGALYVGKTVGTQFDLRSDANETLGQVVSSSVYLGENGTPGAMAQVDLTA
jgi:hypothetical protein